MRARTSDASNLEVVVAEQLLCARPQAHGLWRSHMRLRGDPWTAGWSVRLHLGLMPLRLCKHKYCQPMLVMHRGSLVQGGSK